MVNGEPAYRSLLIHDEDYSIVDRYQAEFRGVVQYYIMAVNVAHLGKLQWVTLPSKGRRRPMTTATVTYTPWGWTNAKCAAPRWTFKSTTSGATRPERERPRSQIYVETVHGGATVATPSHGGLKLSRETCGNHFPPRFRRAAMLTPTFVRRQRPNCPARQAERAQRRQVDTLVRTVCQTGVRRGAGDRRPAAEGEGHRRRRTRSGS